MSYKMFDFTSRNNKRLPGLCGVFHDGNTQCAYATDGFIMLKSGKFYKPELAGKLVDRKGRELDHKRPDYSMVLRGLFPVKTIDIREDLKKALQEGLGIVRINLATDKKMELTLNVNLTKKVCAFGAKEFELYGLWRDNVLDYPTFKMINKAGDELFVRPCKTGRIVE